jgi:hypothetical protein
MRSWLVSIMFAVLVPLTASAQPKVEGTSLVCDVQTTGRVCTILAKVKTYRAVLERLRQTDGGKKWKYQDLPTQDYILWQHDGETMLGFWVEQPAKPNPPEAGAGLPTAPGQAKADQATIGLVVACRVEIFSEDVRLGAFQGVSSFSLAVFVNGQGEIYTCPVKATVGCDVAAARGLYLNKCLDLADCAENSRDNHGLKHCSNEQ